MRVSWKWLSEILDLSANESPMAVAELLTQRGLEVESVDRLDAGFDRVVIAQILEKSPHPQADRLSLCKVAFGPAEPLDIVCGAQNMKAGDKVALAQVGALLPNGLKITESKIRGVASQGMLCSEQELGLKDTSEGILILPQSVAVGLPLAQVLGRDDIVFHLKLTANRGDCLSHMGIARELASAWGKKLKVPTLPLIHYGQSPISVELHAGDLAPQFFGCRIEGVKVGPSPAWLVHRLEVLGSRSINNVVDATNLVMLEMGHPTHAYDAKEIQGGFLQVRIARPGEDLPLLDGQSVTLQGTEVVIADKNRAVALAGVMGGSNSEVQSTTTSVFLECAEFDPVSVRRASTRYQRKTEAAHRFERGIDPAALPNVLARLVQWVTELAGGKVSGGVREQLPSRGPTAALWRREIHFGKHYVNDFLGFPRNQAPLTEETMVTLLSYLDCGVSRPQESSQEWKIIPPTYRLDLNLKEDIAEEIARSLGYDVIPSTIPVLTSAPKSEGSSRIPLAVMDRAKESFVNSGLNETINLAFTSKSWLERFGLVSSVKVLNPLSEEHEQLVPSLLPGLVRNALDNWNHHFGSEQPSIRLFELRPVYQTKSAVIEATDRFTTGVEESWKLAWLISGSRFAEALRNEKGEVDFYDLKAVFDNLLTNLGARGVRMIPMEASRSGGNPLFHPGQSAEILAGNRVAGHLGLLHPKLAKEMKTRAPLWVAELDWKELSSLSRKGDDTPTFKSWSEFPPMERDFALQVKEEVTAEKLCQIALKAGKPVAKSAKVFDIYRGSQVSEGLKSVAIRVVFYDESRSLLDAEVEAASAQILQSWKKDLAAELRS